MIDISVIEKIVQEQHPQKQGLKQIHYNHYNDDKNKKFKGNIHKNKD